jgi:hypothetical protein
MKLRQRGAQRGARHGAEATRGADQAQLEERFEDKKRKITQGDDLAPGVLKMVKVYRGGQAAHPAR